MASATIKIFLVYGDPKRLRTAELSNWTGFKDSSYGYVRMIKG